MDTKQGLLFFGFVCLQAVLVSAAPDWVPPEIFEMVADDKARCMGEHGTTQAQIDEVDQGKLENNPSITCYMYCLLEAFSLVDDEGNLDADMMLGLLPESLQERAESIVGQCTPTTGTDNCNKIFNLASCVQKLAPDVWFIL
ncbi:General odorant-binding protein 69a [Anthophora plagiata]